MTLRNDLPIVKKNKFDDDMDMLLKNHTKLEQSKLKQLNINIYQKLPINQYENTF